eukprot:5347299-Prymnesium_polylepis.1
MANPTFLCALDWSRGASDSRSECAGTEPPSPGWHQTTCIASTDYSALPTGLTEDVDALQFDSDMDTYAYTGPTSGSASQL